LPLQIGLVREAVSKPLEALTRGFYSYSYGSSVVEFETKGLVEITTFVVSVFSAVVFLAGADDEALGASAFSAGALAVSFLAAGSSYDRVCLSQSGAPGIGPALNPLQIGCDLVALSYPLDAILNLAFEGSTSPY
jgi:hypothetical protein